MRGASMIEASPIAIEKQQTVFGQPFPHVLECQSPEATLDATVDWLRGRRAELLDQASEYGAILFRGFPVASAEDFDAFIAAFDLPNFPYNQSLSNAVRINWTKRVFSANEAPPEITIFFHHEMAQTPIFPSKLFFFCEQPAEQGGETPICRSDLLFEQLSERCPEFARHCEQKGLRYSNVMPSENDPLSGMGRSWQGTLGTETREQAEARLAALHYTWEWLPDNCLRATTPVLPAVREVAHGRKSLFNQLIAAFLGWKDSRNDPSKAIRFGDGEPLDADAVKVAAELAEGLAFDVPWQSGDVVLLDNFLVMHGRRSFVGKRKVLASLVAMQSHGAATSDAMKNGPQWNASPKRVAADD
jgi:hypothetical protein